MSSLEQRLEKLAERLTAKERALLVLRAFKEERPQDPAWRRTMPQEQLGEFNRYVTLLQGLNVQLTWYLLVLYQEVEELEPATRVSDQPDPVGALQLANTALYDEPKQGANYRERVPRAGGGGEDGPDPR